MKKLFFKLVKQKLTRNIHPSLAWKENFYFSETGVPNLCASCSIKATGQNSSLHCKNREAARPVYKVGLGLVFFFFSFPLGLAYIILDKQMTIWHKFQTY